MFSRGRFAQKFVGRATAALARPPFSFASVPGRATGTTAAPPLDASSIAAGVFSSTPSAAALSSGLKSQLGAAAGVRAADTRAKQQHSKHGKPLKSNTNSLRGSSAARRAPAAAPSDVKKRPWNTEQLRAQVKLGLDAARAAEDDAERSKGVIALRDYAARFAVENRALFEIGMYLPVPALGSPDAAWEPWYSAVDKLHLNNYTTLKRLQAEDAPGVHACPVTGLPSKILSLLPRDLERDAPLSAPAYGGWWTILMPANNARDACALVLGGAPGSGKTHTAIKMATEAAGDDGIVVYVPLPHVCDVAGAGKDKSFTWARTVTDAIVSQVRDRLRAALHDDQSAITDDGSVRSVVFVLDEAGGDPALVRALAGYEGFSALHEGMMRLFGPQVRVATVLCGSGFTRETCSDMSNESHPKRWAVAEMQPTSEDRVRAALLAEKVPEPLVTMMLTHKPMDALVRNPRVFHGVRKLLLFCATASDEKPDFANTFFLLRPSLLLLPFLCAYAADLYRRRNGLRSLSLTDVLDAALRGLALVLVRGRLAAWLKSDDLAFLVGKGLVQKRVAVRGSITLPLHADGHWMTEPMAALACILYGADVGALTTRATGDGSSLEQRVAEFARLLLRVLIALPPRGSSGTSATDVAEVLGALPPAAIPAADFTEQMLKRVENVQAAAVSLKPKETDCAADSNASKPRVDPAPLLAAVLAKLDDVRVRVILGGDTVSQALPQAQMRQTVAAAERTIANLVQAAPGAQGEAPDSWMRTAELVADGMDALLLRGEHYTTARETFDKLRVQLDADTGADESLTGADFVMFASKGFEEGFAPFVSLFRGENITAMVAQARVRAMRLIVIINYPKSSHADVFFGIPGLFLAAVQCKDVNDSFSENEALAELAKMGFKADEKTNKNAAQHPPNTLSAETLREMMKVMNVKVAVPVLAFGAGTRLMPETVRALRATKYTVAGLRGGGWGLAPVLLGEAHRAPVLDPAAGK